MQQADFLGVWILSCGLQPQKEKREMPGVTLPRGTKRREIYADIRTSDGDETREKLKS